jgi:fucose permease
MPGRSSEDGETQAPLAHATSGMGEASGGGQRPSDPLRVTATSARGLMRKPWAVNRCKTVDRQAQSENLAVDQLSTVHLPIGRLTFRVRFPKRAAPVMRPILLLSAASFGVLGACLTLPGTLLPLLVDQFGIRLVEAGSMLALQPVAYLVAVIVAGRLINRFGIRAVLSVGLLTSAVGFAGFGVMSVWLGGAAMMFLTGLGFGVMEVGTNSLLIHVGGERRSNLLNFAHLFFGVGSFIAPVLSAHAVAAGLSWRILFFIAGGMVAGLAASWRAAQIHGATAVQPALGGAAASSARSPLAVLLALTLATYVGAEMGLGGWLTKYMVSVRAATLTAAGNALSLYWLGLAAGRLALSVLSHRVRDENLLLILAPLSFVFTAMMLVLPQRWAVTACIAATGVAFSGIFPAVIALGGRHHPHDVAGATSMMIAGAGVGGVVIPWSMSAIADAAGLITGMAFYALMCAVMTILVIIVSRSLPPTPRVATPRSGGFGASTQ